MENSEGVRFGIMDRDRRRKHWAKYDKCEAPGCNALAGNPCRMKEALGAVRTLSKAHMSRKLVEVKA